MMDNKCNLKHNLCQYYKPDNELGFKLIFPQKGEQYQGKRYNYHSLVFVLEGVLEFSYNDFLKRHFFQGDLFFLPQAAEMHGTALEKCKLLVLAFNNHIKSICDNCCKLAYMEQKAKIAYDFTALKLTETMLLFTELVEYYISGDRKCSFLHEIKQKELFILMADNYSQKDLLKLFYPIVGNNIDFKSRIFENYRYGIRFQELAQQFGMSYSSFFKKFKTEFDEPIREWTLKQKAKHIKLRLSIPSVTQADIIQDFGFTDAPHFNKFCKKHFGCTPSELINDIRKRETTSFEP